MVPVRAGAVAHFKLVHIGLPAAYRVLGMAIHVGRHVQPVPMNNAFLRQFVGEMDAHLLSPAQAQRGA